MIIRALPELKAGIWLNIVRGELEAEIKAEY